MTIIHYVIDHSPKAHFDAIIRDGIKTFNRQVIQEEATHWSIYAKDEQQIIIGGALIWEHSDALYIDVLWVHEVYRLQKIGQALSTKIEAEAKRKNLLKIYVDTYAFQAQRFYEKCGFYCIGRINDYLLGFDRIFMRKDLRSDSMAIRPDETTLRPLNTYLDLCTQVYDLSKPTPPVDAYAFYRDYAIQANDAILEPMCGSGRFLLPLLKEGFDIQGFDASQHMLNALFAKAALKKLQPHIWRGFIEDWQTSSQFKLIFISAGSFCLLTDANSIQLALKHCYDHLAEQGILLIEALTPVGDSSSLGVWQGECYSRADGKNIMLSKLSFLNDSILTTVCKYELIDNNCIVQTEIEQIHVRLYDQAEMMDLLHKAGFAQVRAIKAFVKQSAPEPRDESIVYECRK
jgi:GNAT superfamily N-acetyltransferase/trans-aconitate methyltransferase